MLIRQTPFDGSSRKRVVSQDGWRDIGRGKPGDDYMSYQRWFVQIEGQGPVTFEGDLPTE